MTTQSPNWIIFSLREEQRPDHPDSTNNLFQTLVNYI